MKKVRDMTMEELEARAAELHVQDHELKQQRLLVQHEMGRRIEEERARQALAAMSPDVRKNLQRILPEGIPSEESVGEPN